MLDAYALEPTAFTSSVEDRRALPMDWWHQRLTGTAGEPERVYGVVDQDAVVATVGIRGNRQSKTRHKAVVFGMYTAPDHRHRGYGAALLEMLVDEAAEDTTLQQLVLTVTEGNESAIRLYRSANFSVFATEPNAIRVDGTGYAKVHMIRYL